MPDPPTSTDINRRCRRCGAAVSKRFVRVFGAQNEVHGCLDCLPRTRLSQGDAANPTDDEPRTRWRPDSG